MGNFVDTFEMDTQFQVWSGYDTDQPFGSITGCNPPRDALQVISFPIYAILWLVFMWSYPLASMEIYCDLWKSPVNTTILLQLLIHHNGLPWIEYPPGDSSKKVSFVYFLLLVFWVILLFCQIVLLFDINVVLMLYTMVTWCHNSTIWRHNSSTMATINRK